MNGIVMFNVEKSDYINTYYRSKMSDTKNVETFIGGDENVYLVKVSGETEDACVRDAISLFNLEMGSGIESIDELIESDVEDHVDATLDHDCRDFDPDEDITSLRRDYECENVYFMHIADDEIKIIDISNTFKNILEDIEEQARKLYKKTLKEKRRSEYLKLKKEFED